MPELSPFAGEHALAKRIAYERKRRLWDQATLATKLTEAGCKMHQSAISKIEAGGPNPRKITLDEALAFAAVFEMPLSELLNPPGEWMQRELLSTLEEGLALVRNVYLDAGRAVHSRGERIVERVDRLNELLGDVPADLTPEARAQVEELVDQFNAAIESYNRLAVALDEPLREAREERWFKRGEHQEAT